ncbi:MAG: PKD domain-containing protein [Bacteroidia bacterium]|nr:PKD domain-containing protein [Bacteroidia bacterium]
MCRIVKISFLLILLALAFSNKALACHGVGLVNLTGVVSGGNLIINAESGAATCGCDPYRMEVELTCINKPFTGTTNYFSASMVKTGCNQEPFPAIIIPLGSLCPGTTYQWRGLEHVLGVTNDNPLGPFSQAFTFTTAGVITPISLTVSASPASLCIPNSSILTTVASGGCGSGYTYSWDNGFSTESTLTVTPTVTTTYNVTITDACSGYTQTEPVTVTVGQAPAGGTASATPLPLCSGGTTTVTLASSSGNIQWQTAPGPIGPWTNVVGATSATLILGPLTVTKFVRANVTGTCGGSVFSNSLIVQVKPIPTITIANEAICNGQTATLTAIPSIAGGTFLWNNSMSTGSINMNPAVTTSYSATYTLNGCTSPVANATVTVNTVPTLTTNDSTICLGQSATLNAISDIAGGTYLWQPGNGTSASITVTPSATTTYTVSYTSNGCSSIPALSTVTVNFSPGVSAGSDIAICSGSSAVLTASGAVTYQWSTGSTNPSITVSPTVTTSYILSGFSNSCPGKDTVTVIVSQPLSVTATSSNLLCNNVCSGEISVNASGGIGVFNYLWNPSVSTSSLGSDLCAGTYKIIVEDSIGCADSVSVNITEPSALTFSMSVSAASCNGTCDATAQVVVSGGTSPYSYLWQNGDTNALADNLCDGIQTLEVTDANNCALLLDTVIYEPSAVTAVISPANSIICIGSSVTMQAIGTGGTGSYSYLWSLGSTTASITVSPIITSQYSVIVSDNNGCSSSSINSNIQVKDSIDVFINYQTVVCAGVSTTLSATANGGDGTYNFIWQPGNINTASITITPIQTTTYTVVVTDGCGTPAVTELITLTVSPAPVANFFSDTAFVCAGGCVLFTGISTIQPGSTNNYQWTFEDGTVNFGKETQKCFNVPGTFDVSLTVTSANGCSDDILLQDYITVGSLPVANFTYDPETPTDLNPLVNFHDNSTFSNQWSWNFGDDSLQSNEQNPSHIFGATGAYCITLLVKSELGCVDSTIRCITVEPESTLFIPNTFTPNSDNLNSVFKVYSAGWDIDFFEMRIFNRWGNEIFNTNDILEGWDGKGSDPGVALGTYAYHIKIQDKQNRVRTWKGHINIIR